MASSSSILALAFFSAVILTSAPASAAPAVKPNILLILADDLGYGDVHCYNEQRGKIPTPHLDALAAQGMRFTDAHTSSGVCSPTRYTLLTGRYHWRSRLQSGIVGYLEDPLIAPDRLTIARLLQQQGYRTGMVGKWHLGWDWNVPPAQREFFGGKGDASSTQATDAHRAAWQDYFSRPIAGGPVTRGFDEYFGTDVPNWPPYCFIENDHTHGIPSEFLPKEKLKNNQASLTGPALSGWQLENILPALADRACAFVEKSAAAVATSNQPFFLYFALTSPHTPISPTPDWRGRSGLNAYADFVMQTDAVVGKVLETLQRTGAADNTLVIFTSDNGCAPYAGAPALEKLGHFPSGPLRGYKADAWEGGHRVPFIVRWPGNVKPGARCDALAQQSDLLATLAEILGAKLPDNAGEDSVSLLPLLTGARAAIREFAVSHASSGLPALRKGAWKIIFGPNGGGFGQKSAAAGESSAPAAGESSAPAAGQLYDLSTDLAETKNLWKERPELVADLTAAMTKIVNDGRSTPGPQQKNDVPVRWKRFLKTDP
jgi:arylsulfatase A-like enzyme